MTRNDVYNSEFILWNNKEITTELSKSIFCKYLFENGFYFVQDLLHKDGKFLSLENVQRKYNAQLNYLKYFPLTAGNLKLFEEKSTGNC